MGARLREATRMIARMTESTSPERLESRRMQRLFILAVCAFPFACLLGIGLLPFFGDSVVTYDALIRVRDGVEEVLPEGAGTARAGDRLGFRIRARRPLHVYAFAVDARGREHTVFPIEGGEPNPLAANELHSLPDDWLWDDFGDVVMLFVYISEAPVEEAEYLATILSAAGGAPPEKRDGATAIKAHMTVHKRLNRRGGVLARRFALRAED